MKIVNRAARAAALVAAGYFASSIASAQGLEAAYAPRNAYAPMYSFQSSSQRDTWHTVLVISAIVAVVGIVQDDTTLILLGGAGVVVSLVESDQNRFRLQPVRRGVDLLRTGPVSFGVIPASQYGPQGLLGARPTPYFQVTFKL